jgi:hypothetical protein
MKSRDGYRVKKYDTIYDMAKNTINTITIYDTISIPDEKVNFFQKILKIF